MLTRGSTISSLFTMENYASDPACSPLGASCDGVLRSSTDSNRSFSSKYYDSVWESAASVYRKRSSIHQLKTRLTPTLSSKPATSPRLRRSIRQMWDLDEGGWESFEEDREPSALDEREAALSDAGSLESQQLLGPACTVASDVQEWTRLGDLSRKVGIDYRQCTDEGDGILDNRRGCGRFSEAQHCLSMGQNNELPSTASVTLKKNVFEGGSSFGVSLLGGVRDSSGQLRTFVTFVDERHNHEGGIKEGDLVIQWNDKKVTGMSFEGVCKLLMETEGQSSHSEETEATVELTRCAETKQTFEKISHSLEAELAKAKESLMTPSLSNLKKEWIEQPGSIQVSLKYDCRSGSLTMGVIQAKLHPLPLPTGQSKADSPRILVNIYLIPAPASSETHRSTKLVQVHPNGDVMWKQTFPPYELQLHELMHTDLQVLVWQYSHEVEYKFLGEVNLLLSDTTLVDLRGQPVWYPLGEHNPNLGELPAPRLARQKRPTILNKLQTRLKLSSQRHSTQNLCDSQVNGTPKIIAPPREAVSLSDESMVQRHRKKQIHRSRSASIPCIVEELAGGQAPSSVKLDSLDPLSQSQRACSTVPVGAMSQSDEGDLGHKLAQHTASSHERAPTEGASVSSDRTGSTWRSFLDSSSTIGGDSLPGRNSSLALFSPCQGCISEPDSVFDSEDEVIDGAASPHLRAPLGSFGVEESRYRKFASTSNLVEVSEGESEQGLSSHRWSQSLSDLTKGQDVACEAPPPGRRQSRTGLLTRMWRRLSSRADEAKDSQGADSLYQPGPGQFVPAGGKGKQLNVVGRVELSLQWIKTTVLKIIFHQLTKTSKKSFHGDCLAWTTSYGDGERLICKRQVLIHFQPKSRSNRSVCVSTEQSNTVQLNMRCSTGRLSKPVIGQVWLSIEELASHNTATEATGWYPLLKP